MILESVFVSENLLIYKCKISQKRQIPIQNMYIFIC